MSDDQPKCLLIVDCAGLLEIARLSSNNRKAHVLAELAAGKIAVAACAWKEFSDLYEDEAAEIEPHITDKIRLSKAYNLGAARLADKLDSGFPAGPYDENTDLYTAAIATKEQYTVLSGPKQLKRYKTMKCNVIDVAAWLDQVLGE